MPKPGIISTTFDKGPIFLDELGEIPLELQAKLLRVLQDGEFEQVGSSHTRTVDVRVIAASNRDLKAASDEGTFRSDLYYRLAVFPIELPPLRDRREDISLLVTYFLARHNAKHGKSIAMIPNTTMRRLESYRWPGNVRELENLIERAVILSQAETLRIEADILRETSDDGKATALPSEPRSRSSQGPSWQTLKEIERGHILAALEDSSWKVKGKGNAAECLGMKESTLRARMKKLGIKRPGR